MCLNDYGSKRKTWSRHLRHLIGPPPPHRRDLTVQTAASNEESAVFFTNLINKNAKKQKHSLILIKRVYQEKTVDSPSAHMKKKTLRIAQETQESIFQPPSHDSVYLVEERQPHRNRDWSTYIQMIVFWEVSVICNNKVSLWSQEINGDLGLSNNKWRLLST